MSKKILISLSVIAIVTAIVVGGTWAYFTDTATSEGNTFSVGELIVRLGGESNTGKKFYTPEAFFNAENMIPGGDCETAYVEVRNDGDMDMLFRAYARDAAGATNLLDYLNVSVTLRPSGYDQSLAGELYGPDNPKFQWDGTLREMYGVDNALDNLDAAFVGEEEPLWPGYVAIYEVEVCLDFNTPNSLQGAEMTASLRVDATQFDGQEDKEKDNVEW